MSEIRILVGLLIGGLFLAAEFIAFWYFGFPAKLIPVVLFAFLAVLGGSILELQRQKLLRRYWDRTCMGTRWRRRFPDAPKAEIREFLILFTDAFAFNRKRRCCFSPDDKVMEVYQASDPEGGPDCMELETFVEMLLKRYRIDFATIWREEITLGYIYQQIRQSSA